MVRNSQHYFLLQCQLCGSLLMMKDLIKVSSLYQGETISSFWRFNFNHANWLLLPCVS